MKPHYLRPILSKRQREQADREGKWLAEEAAASDEIKTRAYALGGCDCDGCRSYRERHNIASTSEADNV